MRSILEKKKKDNSKRNSVIIGGILVLVMIMSTLGYSFQRQDSDTGIKKTVEYNGLEFVQTNNYWYLEGYRGGEFLFKYNPTEIERISPDLEDIEDYVNQPLYISTQNNLAAEEITRNLRQIVERMQGACLENKECENENYPIKNCSNNFIIIEIGETSSITQQENCVFIEGPEENITQLTDDFLYAALGI
jgi:hypothetical protein